MSQDIYPTWMPPAAPMRPKTSGVTWALFFAAGFASAWWLPLVTYAVNSYVVTGAPALIAGISAPLALLVLAARRSGAFVAAFFLGAWLGLWVLGLWLISQIQFVF